MPAWLIRPIPVHQAAEAIVRGVEQRSARVIAPGWIPLGLALRGPLGWLDDYLAGNPAVQNAFRVAERAVQATGLDGGR